MNLLRRRCVNNMGYNVRHGKYRGPCDSLKGRAALVRPQARGAALVQFDDPNLVVDKKQLGVGWHKFRLDEFELDSLRYSDAIIRQK